MVYYSYMYRNYSYLQSIECQRKPNCNEELQLLLFINLLIMIIVLSVSHAFMIWIEH